MPVICRPWITLRNGNVIYASNYGKDAFCFEVDVERPKTVADDEAKKSKPSKSKKPKAK